jgi:hypothetical protein
VGTEVHTVVRMPLGEIERGQEAKTRGTHCTFSFPGSALIGPIEVIDRIVEDRWHPAAWLHMFVRFQHRGGRTRTIHEN